MIDKILLAPYYFTLKVRHAMFDCGMRKVHTSEVPTICLGNVTVGGTGKTPHTEMILRTLMEDENWGSRNLAVLSRGYKRKTKRFQQVVQGGSAKLFGDEPQQVKNKFPSVTVAVDKNRIRGCNYLCHPDQLVNNKKERKCLNPDFPAADLIVLDDAFQYRNLRANVNIMLVDYCRPIFNDYLLPLGSLRDLPERIKDSEIIIVSKCPSYLDEWERTKWANSLGLKDFNPATGRGKRKNGKEQLLLFTTISYCAPEAIFPEGDMRYTYSKRLVLFTGIANDKPLQMYLSDNYKIMKHLDFPDHHNFTNRDIKAIAAAAAEVPTSVIATTEKDSQRIIECKKIPLELRQRLFHVPIRVTFLTDSEKEAFKTELFRLLAL